jgi:hypothetical protein
MTNELDRAWHAVAQENTRHPPALHSLSEILCDEQDWRAVVYAIEKLGLVGWDRFGRWGEFKNGSQPVNDALDAVAELIKIANIEEEIFNLKDYINDFRVHHNLHTVGWIKGKVPNFIEFAVNGPLPPKSVPYRDKKRENDLLLIAYLLKLLRGEEGGTPHPEFSTDKAIKAYAKKYLSHVDGLGERTLDEKFRHAKVHWDNK